ncbi:MAG: glycoside hydrolase family 25 [Frankiales bacterium]|nr:glycoside hydrolase family 25 [Frankiales bacterium]
MLRRLVLLVVPVALLAGVLLRPSDAVGGFPSGPDVSRWQHDNGQLIDWNAVRRSGQDFAFMKATGPNGVDPWFTREWPRAKAAGLVVGAYHYGDPSSSADAQAAFAVRTVGSTREVGNLGIVLDLEQTGGLGPRALVAWAHAFLTGVERRTGRTPILYTYVNFWHSAMANDRTFGAYPLWLARYAAQAPAPLPGWSQWTFWQHTGSGRLPGIPGLVDRNVMCCGAGTLAALSDGRSRALASLWRRLGGASGSLGLPLGPEVAVPGGWGQVFQKGYAASGSFGTHVVTGEMWSRYRTSLGVLGPPVADARTVARGVLEQRFASGRIVWSRATGPHALRGSFLARWVSDPSVGLPLSEQGGPSQQFVGGGLYLTAGGVRLVPGALRDRYEELGGATSVLGLPASEAMTFGGLRTVAFQVGQLTEIVVAGQHLVV